MSKSKPNRARSATKAGKKAHKGKPKTPGKSDSISKPQSPKYNNQWKPKQHNQLLVSLSHPDADLPFHIREVGAFCLIISIGLMHFRRTFSRNIIQRGKTKSSSGNANLNTTVTESDTGTVTKAADLGSGPKADSVSDDWDSLKHVQNEDAAETIDKSEDSATRSNTVPTETQSLSSTSNLKTISKYPFLPKRFYINRLYGPVRVPLYYLFSMCMVLFHEWMSVQIQVKSGKITDIDYIVENNLPLESSDIDDSEDLKDSESLSVQTNSKPESLEFPPVTYILKDVGPFKFTRNPMYLTTIVLSPLVFAVLLDDVRTGVIFFVVLSVYINFWVVPAEEKLLKRLYGREYREWCRRVPRWLIW